MCPLSIPFTNVHNHLLMFCLGSMSILDAIDSMICCAHVLYIQDNTFQEGTVNLTTVDFVCVPLCLFIYCLWLLQISIPVLTILFIYHTENKSHYYRWQTCAPPSGILIKRLQFYWYLSRYYLTL